MPPPNASLTCRRPPTACEALAAQQMQCMRTDWYFARFGSRDFAPPGTEAFHASGFVVDQYSTTIERDFALDGPVFVSLLPALAEIDPQATARLIAMASPPPERLRPAEADAHLNKFLESMEDAAIGKGNIAGNLNSVAEAALREYWRREAMSGFRTLLAGDATHIKLNPYVSIESRKIARDGTLRRGAAIHARVQGMPTRVIQRIDNVFQPKQNGSVGAVRVSARNMAQLERASIAVADARFHTSQWLRRAGAGGGAVLAFGPSAAFDFYDAYTTNSGAGNVARDFAVRSARSQSGNLVGYVAGAVVIASAGAVTAPIVLISLLATVLSG